MTLGQSLAIARKKKGISQEQAGEKLGVSRQTVSNWELEISHSYRYHHQTHAYITSITSNFGGKTL